MKLTILGSGSPEAYARRASSGYLLEIGSDALLFDCGGGVFDNLLRSGRKPSDVTHVFFSHLHSDHMMDYARLVHAAWDEGGARLKVFGPAPIALITDGFFGPDGVLNHDLRARTEFLPSQEVWKARGGSLPRPWPAPAVTEIPAEFTLEGNDWVLKSCEVPHAQPFLQCMAFSLEHAGKKLVYSGDAGLCDPLRALAADADLLIHWCYRLDGEPVHPVMVPITPAPSEIAQMANTAGVKKLILSHFRIHMDEPSAYQTALDSLRRIYGDDCAIAEDLDVYQL